MDLIRSQKPAASGPGEARHKTMNEYELKINMIAQEMIEFSEGISWFDSLQKDDQKSVLDSLYQFCHQVHPRRDEIDEAIERSQLKKTYTPCVLIKKEGYYQRLKQIVELPSDEYLKSFQLLVVLLGIADKRRRATDCINGCSHEWHNIKIYTKLK